MASGHEAAGGRQAGGVRWRSAWPPSPGWRSPRRRSWWLLLVGAAAIAAAWFYTGGPRPYGYAGLGELFVFVFFGLVATVGTTYVAVERITGLSVVMGCAAGCLSCALLVVNNLRDIPSDTTAGKRTLAVRLGDARTRALYVALLAPPSCSSPSPRRGGRGCCWRCSSVAARAWRRSRTVARRRPRPAT